MKLTTHNEGRVTVLVLSRRNVLELYRQIEALDNEDYMNIGLQKVIDGQLVQVTIEADQPHYGKDLAKVRDFNYGRGRGKVERPGAPKRERRNSEGHFDRLKAFDAEVAQGRANREDYHTDEV